MDEVAFLTIVAIVLLIINYTTEKTIVTNNEKEDVKKSKEKAHAYRKRCSSKL